MIVSKGQDLEARDTGVMRGEKPSGITIKWLVHRELGNESYGHRFAVREFVIGADSAVPKHSHKYVQAVYIISGRAIVEGDNGKAEIGPGDLICIHSGEPHAITPVGGKPVKLVCCIDCVNGGENCSAGDWLAQINYK